MRVVSPALFNSLACNRCGACCTDLWLYVDPRAVLAEMREERASYEGQTHEQTCTELATIIDMLRPLGSVQPNGQRRYTCIHFARDAAGLGVCRIYERRPAMCRDYPYGRPAVYPTCSWRVHVVKRPLPVIQGKGAP